jgi:hypothetical protein
MSSAPAELLNSPDTNSGPIVSYEPPPGAEDGGAMSRLRRSPEAPVGLGVAVGDVATLGGEEATLCGADGFDRSR